MIIKTEYPVLFYYHLVYLCNVCVNGCHLSNTFCLHIVSFLQHILAKDIPNHLMKNGRTLNKFKD